MFRSTKRRRAAGDPDVITLILISVGVAFGWPLGQALVTLLLSR